MTSLLKLPGFIDVHVHLREPGATHEEDFKTGTEAAVAGGTVFVIDMPNNPIPTFSSEALSEKKKLSDSKEIIPVGFHYGTNGKNLDTFVRVWSDPRVFGLKIYCNYTTGEYLVNDEKMLDGIFKAWDCGKPILVHAEGEQLKTAIALAKKYSRRLHVCHISQAVEIEDICKAKEDGLHISAGVTPHHLFLTDKDSERLKSYALMKPPLGLQSDQDALWKALHDGVIDLIETDHAPHTKEEKESDKPPFGVPGLETALPLLLIKLHKEKITLDEVIRWTFKNPKKLFSVPIEEDTYIEIDMDRAWVLQNTDLKTKCGWSPFNGWQMIGKVTNVMFKGKMLLKNAKLLN